VTDVLGERNQVKQRGDDDAATERDEMLPLGSGEGVVRRKTLPVTLFESRAA
jgi:hypothetical protein